MGLLTKLFNDASDSEFKLAQDMVAIAMADGEISEAERKMITEVCQKEGISNETITDFMLGFDQNAKSVIPIKHRDKTDYLTKLIRVMSVDGQSSHLEIYLLELIASKMRISHMELISLVLMTVTHRNFPGDIGSKALTSFLENVIDPRGKRLEGNRNSLKNFFDMMARNIPQIQNKEKDKAAFVKAMNAATNLLIANSLLNSEFRAMGIDFETVLMDEREQAIRRWMQTK